MTSTWDPSRAVPNLLKATKEQRAAEREGRRLIRKYQRLRESQNRSRRSYGGVTVEHPTYDHFHDAIFLRDRGECVACLMVDGRHRDASELAHLMKRGGMGGRRTSTVNFLWNAIAACYEHARATDVDMDLCRRIVRWLSERHDYILPPEVEVH